MFYVLFRPPKKDSEKDSQSFSNGKTPKNYVRRVMKMDQDEKEKIQKEIWQKQREEFIRQASVKPEMKKLGREEKQYLRFHLYATPFGLLAALATVWAIMTCNPGTPKFPGVTIIFGIIGVAILFPIFTMLFGGIALIIYLMIYQPWAFIRIPEDKLPPLDDSEDNQDH